MAEVEVTRDGAVLTITLNRPEVLNAINLAVHKGIAGESASFIPGFIGIALVPDSGGSFFIARLLGQARAFEWMTSNRKLSAQEAVDWGLVSVVVGDDDLAPHTAELAATYAAAPTK